MIINENCTVETFEIDEFKFLVVDDVLANPQMFRDDAIEIYNSNSKTEVVIGYELYPDPQKWESLFPNAVREIFILLHKHLGENIADYFKLDPSHRNLQIIKGPLYNCVYKLPYFPPHVDRGHISSFLHLTPEDKCSGGTGIYRHIPTKKMNVVQEHSDLSWMTQIPLSEPLNYSTEEWELLTKLEMKYNRLSAFNSSVIHKIFFEPGATNFDNDINTVRLSLNNFFRYTKRRVSSRILSFADEI